MHNISSSTKFDFDEWANLAKEDPDAFENKRQQMIQDVLDKSSPKIRRRMEGLQWQIDQVRATSTNPMASCLKISQMMWDKTIGEDGLVDHLKQLTDPSQIRDTSSQARRSATIMDLKDRLNKDKD